MRVGTGYRILGLGELGRQEKKTKMRENARQHRADFLKRYTGIECREELGAEMYF